MQDNIEPMSEKTCSELSEILKQFRESTKRMVESSRKSQETIKKFMIRHAHISLLNEINRFQLYLTKWYGSTIITQWYWRKKAIKSSLKVNDLSDYYEKLKEQL